MRAIPRIAAVLLAAAAATLSTMPAASAVPRASVAVYGGVTAEYVKRCTSVEPFVCGTYTNVASFTISVWNTNSPVTVSYEFLSGTATAGVDFTGPYTGSVTIQPNFPQAWVSVPVVNDGIAEPTESLSLRVTGVSVRANTGAQDETLIFDGGNMPADCNLARDRTSFTLTCTDRPAGEVWHLSISCDRGPSWPNEWTRYFRVAGADVTGSGSATTQCPDGLPASSPAYVAS